MTLAAPDPESLPEAGPLTERPMAPEPVAEICSVAAVGQEMVDVRLTACTDGGGVVASGVAVVRRVVGGACVVGGGMYGRVEVTVTGATGSGCVVGASTTVVTTGGAALLVGSSVVAGLGCCCVVWTEGVGGVVDFGAVVLGLGFAGVARAVVDRAVVGRAVRGTLAVIGVVLGVALAVVGWVVTVMLVPGEGGAERGETVGEGSRVMVTATVTGGAIGPGW